MKQSEIDKMKKAQDYYYSLDKEYQRIKNKARYDLDQLRNKCDHLYPDGTSAIKGYMFCNSCEICSWCDM